MHFALIFFGRQNIYHPRLNPNFYLHTHIYTHIMKYVLVLVSASMEFIFYK